MLSSEMEWTITNSDSERLEELLYYNQHNAEVVEAIVQELDYRNGMSGI